MKKILIAALAASALGCAGFAAHADEFTLDLKRIDPATAKGQAAMALWKTQVADAYCGPVQMPQPLDLAEQRAKCQVAVKADAQARIDAALARQQAALKYRVLASR